MKAKFYISLIIILFTSFKISAQCNIGNEAYQKAQELFEKKLYFNAKNQLNIALNQANNDIFHDEECVIHIEYLTLRCDIYLEPQKAINKITRWTSKYKKNPLVDKLVSEIAKDIVFAGEPKFVVSILKDKPNLTSTQNFYLAFAYFQLKDYSKSEELFLPLSKITDVNIRKPSLYYLGYSYLENNKFNNTIEAFQELEKMPEIINSTVIFPEVNESINKKYFNDWVRSLYKIGDQSSYKSITDLAERKNIFKDKAQNIFDRNTQKFIAQIYHKFWKHKEADNIYKNLNLDMELEPTDFLYHVLSQLELAGDDKEKLEELINILKILIEKNKKQIDLNSGAYLQKVYLSFANVYIKLKEYELADINLDRLLEINKDTLLNRTALLTKIKLKSRSNKINLAYKDAENYILKYPNHVNEKSFSNTIKELFIVENNLELSIKNIEALTIDKKIFRSIYQEYSRANFLSIVNSGKEDFKSLKKLFDLSNYYKNNKYEEIELHTIFLKVILKESTKYSKLFESAKLSLATIEREFEISGKDIKELENYQPYIKARKEIELQFNERNKLFNLAIQQLNKYFEPNNNDLITYNQNRYDYLLAGLFECYLGTNNKEFDNQLRLVKIAFNNDLVSANTRILISQCFQEMVKSNKKYLNDYKEILNYPKQTSVERENYTFQYIKIFESIMDKDECSELDSIYTLIHDYLAKHSAHADYVNKLKNIINDSDDCPKNLNYQISLISSKIDSIQIFTKNSFELLDLYEKRASLYERLGKSKSDKTNAKYNEIKRDLKYVYFNAERESIKDNVALKLIKFAKENDDEIFIDTLSTYLTKIEIWNNCIKLREKGKSKEAIEALRKFKNKFPEPNAQFPVSYIIGEIYYKQKDYLNAYVNYSDVISNWNSFSSKDSTLRRTTYCITISGIQNNKLEDLIKLFEDVPIKYLPYNKLSSYLDYLALETKQSGNQEAYLYILEKIVDNLILSEEPSEDKQTKLVKLESLLNLYEKVSQKKSIYYNKKKHISTLKKTINYIDNNEIQNTFPLTKKLIELVSTEEKLDEYWPTLENLKGKRANLRDTLAVIDELKKTHEIRCQLNDYENMNLINLELISLGQKNPGIIKTKTEIEAGANAILDYAKTLYYQNKFQELNSFLYEFIYNEEKNKLFYESQKLKTYPEAYLLLGLTFEKLNNCQDAKELFANGYNYLIQNDSLSDSDKIIKKIINDRYEQLKCNL